MADIDRNKQVHLRWLEECWGDGDIDLHDELVHDDVVDHNPWPGIAPGLEGQRALLRMFRAAFDMHTEADLVLADGDYVIARWTARVVHKGEFMGLPPSGKEATFAGIDICKYRDGKIAEIWHQEDAVSLMQQLGALPAAT